MPRSRCKNTGLSRSLREKSLVIPLFAESLAHSSVPLAFQAAVARSRGQGRPQAGACALLLTAPSTMASTRRLAAGANFAKGAKPMDLVTLVTACALSVDPKLMHALVWHQSGGEPWAVSVQGEANPRVYPDMREAIREIRSNFIRARFAWVSPALSVSPSKVAASVLLPCRNVAMAAVQITKHANPVQDTSAVQEPMRRSVRSRFIGAHGSSRTSSSRPTSRHLLRREMRRISTCQAAPARRFSTRPPSFRSTPGHPPSTSPRRSPIEPAELVKRVVSAKVQSTSQQIRRQRSRSVINGRAVNRAHNQRKRKRKTVSLFVRRSSNEPAQ